MSIRYITVVAAAIAQEGQAGELEILIARRAPHDQGAGVWEFPGGKVEEGEGFEEALVREIDEELNVQVHVDRYLGQNDYALTPTVIMHLHVFLCVIKSGEIKLVDHDAFEWHQLEKFPTTKISGADQPFVQVMKDILS